MLKAAKNQPNITKLYRDAGLPAPKGRGLHTMAFHKLVIKVARGYVKGTKKRRPMSPQAALDLAFPTAMKLLGRNKAVRKEHWDKNL